MLGPVGGRYDLPTNRDMEEAFIVNVSWILLPAGVLALIGYCAVRRDVHHDETFSVAPGAPQARYSVLPAAVRHAYCLPALSAAPMNALMTMFGLSFYSRRGADLPTMAMIMALARTYSAICDPVIATLTDGCRSGQFGRRKPFILAGAPLYGLFVYALFSPPYLSSVPLAGWFAIMYVGYCVTDSLTNIPYSAWGSELTYSSKERSKLYCLSGCCEACGLLLAVIMLVTGFAAAQYWGLSKDICVPLQDLGRNCSSGLTCALFMENGPGWESSMGATPWHGYEEGLNWDCDDDATTWYSSALRKRDTTSTFCGCISGCQQACASSNRSFGFSLTASFFAVWYILAQYINCCFVRERPRADQDAPPLLPSLVGAVRNPAIAGFLPALAADAFALSSVLFLGPYYVMYVVAPEYQTPPDSEFGIACKEGARGLSTSPHYDGRCNSQVVLGVYVTSALLAAVVATPLWLSSVAKIGKKRTWIVRSAMMAALSFLFLLFDQENIHSLLVVFILYGTTISGSFVTDIVLADIIDYDELLYGRRNEATYTMLKGWVPNVTTVAAITMPLLVMNALGHVASVQGQIMWQTRTVRWAIKIMIGGVPGIVALFSLCQKRKLPLDGRKVAERIHEGVSRQRAGTTCRDPLSGLDYRYTRFTHQENRSGVWDVDHFWGVEVALLLRADPVRGTETLRARAVSQAFVAGLMLLLSLACLGSTLPLLATHSYSFLPFVLIFVVSSSLLVLGICLLRLRAAQRLMMSPPGSELANKILKQRELLDKMVHAHREGLAHALQTVEQFAGVQGSARVDGPDHPAGTSQSQPRTDDELASFAPSVATSQVMESIQAGANSATAAPDASRATGQAAADDSEQFQLGAPAAAPTPAPAPVPAVGATTAAAEDHEESESVGLASAAAPEPAPVPAVAATAASGEAVAAAVDEGDEEF